MSATVYGTARYGLVDDVTATGLFLGSFSVDSSVEEAFGKNHIGCDVVWALFNDGAEVTFDGIVAVKATGFTINLASVVALANSTADTLNALTANLFTTPVANAGLVMKAANLDRTSTEFETGSGTASYKPLIATNSPVTLN